MGLSFVRYLLPFLLIIPINGTDLGHNETIETNEAKTNRRIVRLYSGTRPKPIVCIGEGFQADPTDCAVFHRCMKNGNGRYMSFRFQCGPGTIYDPESEICNHPEKTKRTNCGGNVPINFPDIEFSLDTDVSKEIPSPINMRDHSSAQGSSTRLSSLFTSQQYSKPTSPPLKSSFWEYTKTTKISPTKRQVKESFSYPTSDSWMSYQKMQPTTSRTVNRQTTSQAGDACTSDGFMGDSENCRRFYRCINNQRGGYIRYEFMCSEPTIWDDEKQSCNHAWAVKRKRCGRGSYPDNHEVSSTETEILKSSTEKSKNVTPLSSQSQLQINYGSKVTQTQTQISNGSVTQNQTQINYGQGTIDNYTSTNQVIQNQTQISHGDAISQTQTQINYGDKAVQTQLQIDHSKDSSQAQSQISESTSTVRSTQYHEQSSSSTHPNVCTQSGFVGDSEDCKKFYRCVDNGRGSFTRHEFTCGEGTVWDPKIEACNHAWAVKECGGKSPSDSITQSTIGTTQSSLKPTGSTSVYTTTSTTTTQGYYSSSDESIDEDNDIPYGYQPSSSSKPSLLTTTTTKTTQILNNNNCQSTGFMGDSSDCKKFYRCVDNGNGGYTRYEFSCGEGTVWDQKIEACNHAWAVENCGGTQSSNNGLIQTTTASGVHTSQTENIDQGYDSHYGEYSSSSIATTSTTIKSSTKTTTQSSTTNIGNDCISSGFMGDNNDCKKFYRCVENSDGGYTKYEFSCGEGTVWDSKIQACNHAWAVEKCGGNSAEDINKVDTTTRKEVESTSILSSTMPLHTPDSGYGPQTDHSTSQPAQKPEIKSNECSASGFMGDANDCKKFYRCVDNGDGTYTRYEFSCGEGTLWDSKIEACNHAWAVEKCGGINAQPTSKPLAQNNSDDIDNSNSDLGFGDEYVTQSTTSTSSSTTVIASSSDKSCKSNGFIGDSMDCKKFYRCVDNSQGGFTRYEFACGEGTVWDQNIEACNHKWAVKGRCSQSGSTETSYGSTTTETVLIDPGQDDNQPQKTSTARPTPSKPPVNLCTQEGFYADMNNCKNFYRCVDDDQGSYIKYEFSCGDGTVWNQDIQACDHESSNKKCNTHASESTTTTKIPENDEMITVTTTKGPSSTNSENNLISERPQASNDRCELEGFYGDSKDCKKFYRCVDDGKGGFIKYDFSCGDGTVWDQEILSCNHETNNKKCASQQSTAEPVHTPDSDSSTQSQEQHTSQKPESINSSSGNDQCEMDGFHADSADCKKFYRCVSNGRGGYTKYEFSCAEGTVWVQEIQACDYENDISSCTNKNNNSTRPQTTQQQSTSTSSTNTDKYTTQSQISDKEDDEYPNSTSRPSEKNETCQSEGFFANEHDCTRFYRCVDNGQGGYTKYDFTCGEGTAWDTNIQTCNHISEVENCQDKNSEGSQSKPSNDEDSSQSSVGTSTTKGSTSTESSKPSKTDKCEEAGYYGNTEDCKKFYRCVDNGKGGFTKYDFTCGEGTIWDQDLTTCNHPQDVTNPSCTNNENTQSSSNNPSMTGSSETSSSTNQSSGSTDSTTQGLSNCTQESSTKKPANQKVKCDKAGFYPDPDDCKKFYRCVDWDGNGERFSVYHFECGEGTIWDPQLETCNHEDSVYPPRNCSGGQSQTEGVAQETTTTEKSTTSQDNSSTESSTTAQSSTDESTTTQQSTSEQTTQQSSTTEKTTTTTQQTSSTTQQSSSEPTTTETTTTTQEQTTQESTTTTQQQTSSEQTTATEKTTTQESSEQTTTQQSTTSGQSTTQQSTTSEQTTSQQSTTSEQTTQQSTTQQSSSTDDTTTTESTTSEQTTSTTEQSSEQSSTTEQSTTESTTQQQTSTAESSTTSTTASSESTSESDQTTIEETSSAEQECPETEDDQFMYVCPTSFRRHPKYCNMFYQCTEDDDTHEVKIATFKCPNNTIYDESKTQCVEEDKADKKCNGQMARKYRVKRLNPNYKEPIEVSPNQHTCNTVGYYPFEKNNECSGAFIKCQKTKLGKLRGYVHRCPEGYTYWSISKRCEKKELMKDCKQSVNTWKDRWEIPVEKKNIAK